MLPVSIQIQLHIPKVVTYHRIISQIGGGLVRRRSSGRTLPAGNVDGVKELAHLGDHCRFKATIGVASLLGLLET